MIASFFRYNEINKKCKGAKAMIGLVIVEENKGLIKNIQDFDVSEVLTENLKEKEFCIDMYDFDTNSFNDLIEYTEFQEYTDYILLSITKTERLKKVTYLLNTHSEFTHFHFISINESSGCWIEQHVCQEQLSNIHQTYECSNDAMQVFKNGLMAMFTGVYPKVFRKGLIKHLYFENYLLIEQLHSSIYLNCGINFGGFVDKYSTEFIHIGASTREGHFPGILLFNDSLEDFIIDHELELMTETALYHLFECFINTGKIDFTGRKSGIIDYSVRLSLGLERGIFVYSDGLYLDYGQTKKLADVNGTILELELGRSNVSGQGKNTGLLELFPLLINVAISLQDDGLFFITPFNKNCFEPAVLQNYPSEWIVMLSNQRYLALHVQSNRMFEVNELFAEIFEADTKNCIELAKKQNENITQEIIREQKELMVNVR